MGKLARYQHLIDARSISKADRPTGCYQAGSLLIDLARHTVEVDGAEIALSPTEFDILSRLVLEGGAVVYYDDLMVDDERDPLDDRDAAELARYHIRNLRQKLSEAGQDPALIVNVRGAGYRLSRPPHRL